MKITGLGKAAFLAYCEKVEGVTHDGKIIPQWEDLTDEVRDGWEYAADTVVEWEKRLRP